MTPEHILVLAFGALLGAALNHRKPTPRARPCCRPSDGFNEAFKGYGFSLGRRDDKPTAPWRPGVYT